MRNHDEMGQQVKLRQQMQETLRDEFAKHVLQMSLEDLPLEARLEMIKAHCMQTLKLERTPKIEELIAPPPWGSWNGC